MKNNDKIVYACAGCSGAGQIAYKLALAMDKQGIAEMSCLAGIASERKSFRREIRNRQIIVIDGCPLECGRLIFEKQNLPVDNHVRLDKLGIRKQEEVSEGVVERLMEKVCSYTVIQNERVGWCYEKRNAKCGHRRAAENAEER